MRKNRGEKLCEMIMLIGILNGSNPMQTSVKEARSHHVDKSTC